MPDYLLVDLDITKEILHEFTPAYVKLRDVKVTVHLPDDRKIVEAAMKDPLLHNKMVNTVQNLVRGDLAKLMAFQVAAADINAKDALQAGQLAHAAAAAASVEQRLANTRTQIIPKIETAAGQVWRELTRTKKEYTAYQVKCGIKIVGSAISTGMSIAAAATAPVLAIALVKAAKDGLELYRNLWSAAVEAETMGAQVQKTLDKLAKWLKDGSAKKAVALEVGHAFIDPIASPEKAKEQNDTYGSKLQGLEVAAHKAAEGLNDILLKSEALQKAIASAPRPAPGSKEAKLAATRAMTRNTELAKLEASVNERIGKIISLGGRVDSGQRQQKDFAAAITGFQKNTPTWIPGALKLVKFVIGANPLEASGLKEAGDIVVDSALAIADSFGDDIVDKVAGESSGPKPPSGPSISSPKLVSTSADLGAMKLKPIGSLNIAPPPSIVPKKS